MCETHRICCETDILPFSVQITTVEDGMNVQAEKLTQKLTHKKVQDDPQQHRSGNTYRL